jgi:hypothetical protein
MTTRSVFDFATGQTQTVELTPEEMAAEQAAHLARQTVAARKGELAAIRYSKEVGGILVGGVPVATDRETQSKLIAARILAKENAVYTVNWKTSAGFVALNAATIIAVADAVASHVQACFDREAVLFAEIDAASDAAARAAIDLSAGWP